MLVAWKPSLTADEFRRLFYLGRVSHGDVEKTLGDEGGDQTPAACRAWPAKMGLPVWFRVSSQIW